MKFPKKIGMGRTLEQEEEEEEEEDAEKNVEG